jgi:hypothetical protein
MALPLRVLHTLTAAVGFGALLVAALPAAAQDYRQPAR